MHREQKKQVKPRDIHKSFTRFCSCWPSLYCQTKEIECMALPMCRPVTTKPKGLNCHIDALQKGSRGFLIATFIATNKATDSVAGQSALLLYGQMSAEQAYCPEVQLQFLIPVLPCPPKKATPSARCSPVPPYTCERNVHC